MFKRYRDEASDRYLSYAEILDRDFASCSETRHFEEAGVTLEQNTAEEISDAVAEMEARLDGTHASNEEAQNRFRSIGLDYDRARLARVSGKTATIAEYEAPHYCFGLPWVNHVEAYFDRNPWFLAPVDNT